MLGYSSAIEMKESVMSFEDKNKQWLSDNMPFAFEVEEKEEVVNVPPLKRKLHDDFDGE